MAESISSAVGSAPARNHFSDVETIQSLLNQVPANEGGPQPLLDVDGIVGPLTIGAIRQFQRHHFGWQDGRVDPNQQTHTKLNTFDKDVRPGNPIQFAEFAPNTGFDPSGITPGSAPWQMVPFQGSKVVRLVNGKSITRVTSNNTSIAEPQILGSTVLIRGKRIGSTLIKARDRTGRVVARLDVSVKRRLSLQLSYHFVQDKTGQRTARSRTKVDTKFSSPASLTNALNSIWLEQANVEFQQRSIADPQVYNKHDFGDEVHDTAHLGTAAGIRADEWNKVTSRRDRSAVNVFFVWEFENNFNTGSDGQDAAADRFQRSCLVEDKVVDDLDVVVGHEIGHILRLDHVSDTTNLMLNGSGTNGKKLTRRQIERANPA